MARKKSKTAEGVMESKETTFRIDYQVNKRFRIICMILEINPKEKLEDLMKKWADQSYKKIPKEKFEQIAG